MAAKEKPLELRVLGPVAVSRGGEPLALPRSRKTRALLAYLAVTDRPHRRDRLCRLLWNLPDDPRGALRWSLSKLRPLVDEPERPRILANRESVSFDPRGAYVDLIAARRVVARGLDKASSDELKAMADNFRGEFLEGLDVTDELEFHAWLTAEREAARNLHMRILKAVVKRQSDAPDDALPYARTLTQIDPHDEEARAMLARLLAESGRVNEAAEHIDAGEQIIGAGPRRPTGELKAVGQDLRTRLEDMVSGALAGDEYSRPRPSRTYANADATQHEATAKPSIAVLPFVNLSGSNEQDYLAEGIADDLITELSKFRWFDVVARTSSFAYRRRSMTSREIGRELNVRYILEGSVRRIHDRLRLTAQLIEAESGIHVWAERYDREVADLFDLQDDIVERLVVAVEPELGHVERERARRKPPETLAAWDTLQRSIWHLTQFSPEGVARASDLLDQVLRIDPNLAQAYAYKAIAIYTHVMTIDPSGAAEALAEAEELARKAIALDVRDPLCHYALGRILTLLGRYDEAIAAFEEALSVNSRFVVARYGLGVVLNSCGEFDRAIEHLEHVVRLSPRDPVLWSTHMLLGFCHLWKRDYERAAREAATARRFPDINYWPYIIHTAALEALGEREAASDVMRICLNAWPDLSRSVLKSQSRILGLRGKALDTLLERLADAGLPD